MTSTDGGPGSGLGDSIREARRGVGLTQGQLADLVGVSAHTVWAWESGRMKPTHAHLVEIAFHTDTSPLQLEARERLNSELLLEAEVSFHDAVNGLPDEDIEEIREFIRFVRSRRRRQGRAER